MRIYLNLCFVLHILQLSAQEMNVKPTSIECEIVKIDSVGNNYVIYAKEISKKDISVKYKIISVKDNTVCQNIKIGQYYKLTLYPYNTAQNATYLTFPDGAAIILHGWGYDLYSSLEIKGLCYNIEFAVDIINIKEQEPLKFRNKRAKKKYFHNLKRERKKTRIPIYYEKDPLFEWDYDDK